MNKENETNKVLCTRCKVYTDSFFITKYKDGSNYCSSCNIKEHVAQHNRENLAKESEFDQIIKATMNTPPLKLKDLKEKLRKEREEKKRNSENKKDSE